MVTNNYCPYCSKYATRHYLVSKTKTKQYFHLECYAENTIGGLPENDPERAERLKQLEEDYSSLYWI